MVRYGSRDANKNTLVKSAAQVNLLIRPHIVHRTFFGQHPSTTIGVSVPVVNFNHRPVVKISRKKRKKCATAVAPGDLRHTLHALITLISRARTNVSYRILQSIVFYLCYESGTSYTESEREGEVGHLRVVLVHLDGLRRSVQ